MAGGGGAKDSGKRTRAGSLGVAAITAAVASADRRSHAIRASAALLDYFGRIELACLVLEHHRNAVADVVGQPICLAHEFLFGLAVEQGPLADRAYQDIKQS